MWLTFLSTTCKICWYATEIITLWLTLDHTQANTFTVMSYCTCHAHSLVPSPKTLKFKTFSPQQNESSLTAEEHTRTDCLQYCILVQMSLAAERLTTNSTEEQDHDSWVWLFNFQCFLCRRLMLS